AKGLRQQAGVVVHGQRQGRQQGAQAQYMAVQTQAGGQAQLAVLVHGAAVAGAALGNGGAAAVRAGIPLDAKQAGGIHTQAKAAGGVAGVPFGAHALGPFVGLALGRRRVAEVAVEVQIAQAEAGAAVFEEFGLGGQGPEAAAEQGDGDAFGQVESVHCAPSWLVVLTSLTLRNFSRWVRSTRMYSTAPAARPQPAP